MKAFVIVGALILTLGRVVFAEPTTPGKIISVDASISIRDDLSAQNFGISKTLPAVSENFQARLEVTTAASRESFTNSLKIAPSRNLTGLSGRYYYYKAYVQGGVEYGQYKTKFTSPTSSVTVSQNNTGFTLGWGIVDSISIFDFFFGQTFHINLNPFQSFYIGLGLSF